MRKLWTILAWGLLVGLVNACGNNQCQHVVERNCSELRAKAQQMGSGPGGKLPTPSELCEQLKFEERNPKEPKLAALCASEEIIRAVDGARPRTPRDVGEAMCDGMKLHMLTPTVDELLECRQTEDAYEAEQEKRKEEQKAAANKPKPAEEPAPPKPPPASTPASAATSTSVPASTPASTPATPTTPPATPPTTPPATPPAK